MKRTVSMLCACALAASTLAGCGSSGGGSAPTSGASKTASAGATTAGTSASQDYVELDWYVAIGEQPDGDMVLDKLNEYLLEKLNVKLNFHFLGSDYREKMTTMVKSGEDLGLIRIATDLPYVTNAQQGVFYPMDELLDKYGAGSKGLFSEDVWDSLKVNGNIYCVPTLKDNCYIMGYLYNEDLANELGLDMEHTGWKNGREAGDYLIKALELRDQKHPEWKGMPLVSDIPIVDPYFFNIETFGNNLFTVCNIPGIDDIKGYDDNTVFNLYATPEFKEFCEMQQKLVETGVYAYDYSEYNNISAEPSTLMGMSWGYTWVDEHLYSQDFKTKLVIFDDMYTDAANYTSAATAISANCKHPDRAMQVLELFNTDPYVATLIRFGIEGVHYTKDSNGKMTLDGGRNADPANRGWLYWYGNDFGNLTITEAPESFSGPDNIVFEKMKEYNNSAKLAAHMGFVLNTENIQNEIAACTNVVQEYSDLTKGHYNSKEEVDAALDAMNEKLKANGVDKIIAEVQSQIDAWNATQSK